MIPSTVTLETVEPHPPATTVRCLRRQRTGVGPRVAFVAEVAVGRDREAVGDITVGDELAEHVGREPIHPVLLDLCTGIAGAGAARRRWRRTRKSTRTCSCRCAMGGSYCANGCHGGSIAVRDGSPAGSTARCRSFDLDFVDRDGRNPRWNSRVHGQARTAGGVVAGPRRRCDADVVRRRLAGDSTSRVDEVRRERQLAGCRVRRTGRRTAEFRAVGGIADPGSWRQLLARAAERRRAGVRASCCGPPDGRTAEESRPNLRPVWKAEIGECSTPCTSCWPEGTNCAGGLWVVTERAVATEAGEPVDPAQAALWGLGRTV